MNEKHLFTSDQKLKWWGNGEWVEEIDFDEWEYEEIKCQIIRKAFPDGPELHMFGGHFCGYINVPENHPWFKKKDVNADVHGGITFTNEFTNEKNESTWWIGFDAGHSYDLIPSMQKTTNYIINSEIAEMMSKLTKVTLEQALLSPIFRSEYRNMAYMKKECEKLVDELLTVYI